MDNAPINMKNVIEELVEEAGHQLLFLPKYSPELNYIEHNFSVLKKIIAQYDSVKAKIVVD